MRGSSIGMNRGGVSPHFGFGSSAGVSSPRSSASKRSTSSVYMPLSHANGGYGLPSESSQRFPSESHIGDDFSATMRPVFLNALSASSSPDFSAASCHRLSQPMLPTDPGG